MASLGREFPCENRGVPGDCDKRDKTGMSHAAAIHLAAGVMAAKQLSTGTRCLMRFSMVRAILRLQPRLPFPNDDGLRYLPRVQFSRDNSPDR
ncbi:MAG: hypothetical protein OXE85_05310 [Roseovarius sp.]|nr:hypothetical protein [Roseovarius sp.]